MFRCDWRANIARYGKAAHLANGKSLCVLLMWVFRLHVESCTENLPGAAPEAPAAPFHRYI